MKIFTQIIEAFLLGLIGGAVPGPMLTAVFTEVLGGGFVKSLRVVFRALFSETLVAVLILLIIFSLNVPTVYFYIISFGGSAMLIWIAIQVWKINRIGGEKSEIFSFSKILILTILNGGFWIFWITVCVPRAFLLKEHIFEGQFLFLIAFEIGWLAMTVSLGFIFSRFRPILSREKVVSFVFKIFALLLVFFAIKSVMDSINYLLE